MTAAKYGQSCRTSLVKLHALVKLDLFHAIQRIAKKASKRHSLFNDLISSSKSVFRDPSDLSDVRQLKTPGPDVLEKNLNAFVERWGSVKSHDAKTILTPVLAEINKLRSHIAKGCLSYIKLNLEEELTQTNLCTEGSTIL